MKLGFIGYGSMGSMLINSFLVSKAIKPDEIIVGSRSRERLINLKNEYPTIEVAEDNKQIARKSSHLFICVKTNEVKEVIQEIKESLSDNVHLIYISAGLEIKCVESVFSGKITKIIPSITSEVNEGISLVCHNNAVTQEDAEYINKLFLNISKVKIIDESNFEVGADLTSCAPGFIASIFMQFVNASLKYSKFTKEETEKMLISTLFGTASLLCDKHMSFQEMISRVATKGGITEEGVKILEEGLPDTFDALFKATIMKHEKVKQIIREQYEITK